MVRDSGRPLSLADSKAREFAPLMLFDCRGYEPLDFVYGRGWKAESVSFLYLFLGKLVTT